MSGGTSAGVLISPTNVHTDSDPGTGVTKTAGGTWGRFVFGYAAVVPNAATNQVFDLLVESGVGTGVYDLVTSAAIAANAANPAASHSLGFAFFVPTGRRYKYTKTTGTPTLGAWGYVEL